MVWCRDLDELSEIANTTPVGIFRGVQRNKDRE
jgi:hypothetical protein